MLLETANLKTLILQIRASVNQQTIKFPLATTPSGLMNLDSFKKVSSEEKPGSFSGQVPQTLCYDHATFWDAKWSV